MIYKTKIIESLFSRIMRNVVVIKFEVKWETEES